MKRSLGIMSEDIAITDGESVWPVPWTDTYRDYGEEYVKHIKNIGKIFNPAPAGKIFIIGSGAEPFRDPFEKIYLLNRYDIGYYRSPALLALSYFNENISLSRAEETERKTIKRLIENSKVYCLPSDTPEGYCDAVFEKLTD